VSENDKSHCSGTTQREAAREEMNLQTSARRGCRRSGESRERIAWGWRNPQEGHFWRCLAYWKAL